jgi:Fe(3+) dicitrate transport protein
MKHSIAVLVSLFVLLAMAGVAEAQAPTSSDADADAGSDADSDTDAGSDAGSDADAGSDEDLFTMTEEEAAAIEASEEASEEGAELEDELFEVRELTIAYTEEDVFRTGGSVQLLDEEELRRFASDDPNAVVTRAVGVYVRPEDGFGLRPNIGMRGVSSDRSKKITLMEDGVLFGPAPYSAPAAYYFPIITRAVGVEVFKGPAAVLYGPNTIGGALNLLMRQVPDAPSGEIDMAVGSFGSRRLHAWYGAQNSWGGLVVEGVDLGSQGFKELDGGGDTGFHRGELMARGFLQTAPEGEIWNRLELKLGYTGELSNETYLGLTDEDFRAHSNRRYASTALDQMRNWRTQAVLTHRLSVGDHFELTTDLYRHDFDRTWNRLNRFRDGPELLDVLTSPTGRREIYYRVLTGAADSASVNDPAQTQEDLMVIANARRMVSEGIQTRARFDFETGDFRHEVEAGLRLHYDEIRRDQRERGYRMQGGELVNDGLDPIPVDDNTGSTLAFAGYLVYALHFAGLTVTPGARVEVMHMELDDRLNANVVATDHAVFIPGIGATYAITESLAVLAGVHRGFSPIAPGQPAEVQPETSVNYEAGARFMENEGATHAELVGFHNDYENITGQCGGSTGCPPELVDRQFNGGAANVLGVEVVAAHRFDLGDRFGVPLRATYTFTSATFAADFIGDNPIFGTIERGDQVPYVPEHQGKLEAGIDRGDEWSLNVSATYVGKMREVAGSGDPAPGELPLTDDYVELGARASYRIADRVTLYLSGDNLTDARPIAARRPWGARPIRPITVMGGLRVAL